MMMHKNLFFNCAVGKYKIGETYLFDEFLEEKWFRNMKFQIKCILGRKPGTFSYPLGLPTGHLRGKQNSDVAGVRCIFDNLTI